MVLCHSMSQMSSVLSVWYIFRLFFNLVDLKCWVTSLILYVIPRLLNFMYFPIAYVVFMLITAC